VEIIPLAFDSLGVRSMATFVETDLGIMIDPGLDLAPLRYGLLPSKIELGREKELTVKINEYAKTTDIFGVNPFFWTG
jgi:predicted metallo-beta-lactamase superfamily hydrolase